ncbi:hypothetical protein GCM10027200_52130 [Lentzea nigeriaca]
MGSALFGRGTTGLTNDGPGAATATSGPISTDDSATRKAATSDSRRREAGRDREDIMITPEATGFRTRAGAHGRVARHRDRRDRLHGRVERPEA